MPIDATIPLQLTPLQPMRQLSDLINVRNQAQDFQIGQQRLRSATAEADQNEQINRESQAIRATIQDPNSGVLNTDGTYNVQRAMQLMPKVAPLTWAKYGESTAHSLNTVNDYLTSQQRLGSDASNAVGSVLRSAVGTDGKPKMSMLDLNAQLSALTDQNPGNEALSRYVGHVRNLLLNHADKPDEMNGLLGNLADAAVNNATLRESQRGDTQFLNNGRASIPVNVQPGNAPVGQATGVPTLNQLGPGQSVQLMNGPDGNAYQVVRDPTSGAVTGTSAIGGQGGAPGIPGNGGQGGGSPMPHYAPGQLADTQAAQQEVQQVRNSASQVVTNRHITDTLLDLTRDAKDLGPNSDKWAHAFGTVGMAFDAKMPEVEKYQ